MKLAIAIIALGLACGTMGSAREPGKLYGSLQMSEDHAAMGREAGWRVAVVPVSWDRFETKPGVFNRQYADELAARKQALRKLGYKLQLDPGVQYPPAWVAALPHGRYKNQYGDSFKSVHPGEDLPNVVFNAAVRGHVADYLREIFARLGTDWDFVRLGCARFGELNYPAHQFGKNVNCYWAFDDLAQGKAAGLPPDMEACPVPGWIPGTPSPGHESARRFSRWYLDCLRNYQQWQIATVRQWYQGDICMLYGSWGIRPGWLEKAVEGDLNGDTACECNGEIQQGFDWAGMIGDIHDAHVIVYCTWVDGTIGNRDICDDGSADPARWSPVHWQSDLACANPLHLRVWGENTGGNNRDAMRLAFRRVKQFDLMGLMWAFDPELFARPGSKDYATFHDYTDLISE